MSGSTFTMRLKDVIKRTDGKIGLDDYPLTDESHREVLNEKIINRYFNREIGLETIDQFRFNLRRKMHEIMPYYDKLMQSQLIEFDPLDTLNIRSTSASKTAVKGTGTSESESDSTNSAKAITVNSNFPQQSLRKDDGDNTGIYASESTESDSDANSTGKATDRREDESSSEDSSESTSKGYTGSAAMLLMQYRESIVNYDLEIVQALSELFMSVWQTPEPFTAREGRYL